MKRNLSTKQRNAISRRMTRYWAKRRKAKSNLIIVAEAPGEKESNAARGRWLGTVKPEINGNARYVLNIMYHNGNDGLEVYKSGCGSFGELQDKIQNIRIKGGHIESVHMELMNKNE